MMSRLPPIWNVTDTPRFTWKKTTCSCGCGPCECVGQYCWCSKPGPKWNTGSTIGHCGGGPAAGQPGPIGCICAGCGWCWSVGGGCEYVRFAVTKVVADCCSCVIFILSCCGGPPLSTTGCCVVEGGGWLSCGGGRAVGATTAIDGGAMTTAAAGATVAVTTVAGIVDGTAATGVAEDDGTAAMLSFDNFLWITGGWLWVSILMGGLILFVDLDWSADDVTFTIEMARDGWFWMVHSSQYSKDAWSTRTQWSVSSPIALLLTKKQVHGTHTLNS